MLCIERGGWFDHASVPADPAKRRRLQRGALSANPNVCRTAADYPVDEGESPIQPMFGNGVGGSSIYRAAHAPRFQPENFRVGSEGGAGDNWPLAHDALEPYYRINEQRIGLAWKSGGPGAPAHRHDPMPMPPVSSMGKKIAGKCRALGWHCWPVEIVVGRDALAPAATPCTPPGNSHIGCPARVRAGADRAYVRDAQSAGMELRTHTRALRLDHDARGQVTAAPCAGPGGRLRVRASRFVLAANGIGTPRLLLASSSKHLPNGFANGSGLVGRRLMLHPYGSADGWFTEPFDVREGQMAGIVSLEFASTREELGFIRGCKLQLSIGSSARGVRFQARELTGGSLFAHAAGLSVCAKDMPDPENRIVLSDTRSDNDGVLAPRMVYRVSSNSRRILDFGIERAVEVLEAACAVEIRRTPLKSEAGFHPMGTARIGRRS